MSAREQRRIELLDYSLDHLDGFTVDDLRDEFGWSLRFVNEAIHDMRRYLGDYEDINLPCDPQGGGERWLYRLVGNLDDVRGWAANRMGDADSRLRTIQGMMASIVAATNGRTVVGRKARMVERALRRLIEDLDDIEIDATP